MAASFGLGRKALLAGLGLTGACGGLAMALDESVKAELMLHPPKLPWSHKGPIEALDAASVRRGYQVSRTRRLRV